MQAANGRLIIVCGLPGAGKTTHAVRLEQELPAVRMSADAWLAALGVTLHDEAFRARVEELQWVLAQQLLGLGLTVVIEWGTWGRGERDRLREGARAVGAAVELHWCEVGLEEAIKRVRLRGMEDPPLTREQMEGYFRVFQAPTEREMALFDRVERLGSL